MRLPLVAAALFAAVASFVACGGGSSSPTPPPPGLAPDGGPTTTDEAGLPPAPPSGPPPTDEVGFFDVPAQPTAAKYAARMFYVFQAADADASAKPLVVLFNGGPGYPTTLGLFAYGTARYTLDPHAAVGVAPTRNPASWTSFANLLYIDERQAGFSYGIGDASLVSCTLSSVEDASDFARAIVTFLDAHPSIRDRPVVLAGESYGGVRASMIFELLLRPDGAAARSVPALAPVVASHFDAAFPHPIGTAIDEATRAKQFGAQVLVQPVVLGSFQLDAQRTLRVTDPYLRSIDSGGVDADDVQEAPDWSTSLDTRALAAISDATSAATLLGAPLTSIALLAPSARVGAFHRFSTPNPAIAAANAALATLVGALPAGDAYFGLYGEQCTTGFEFGELAPSNAFVANLRSVRTFITRARYDGNVYTPAIPYVLSHNGFPVVTDVAARPGVARPGWLEVSLPARPAGPTGPAVPAANVEVRFPTYDHAGHEVAVKQPADLAADVAAWLNERLR